MHKILLLECINFVINDFVVIDLLIHNYNCCKLVNYMNY